MYTNILQALVLLLVMVHYTFEYGNWLPSRRPKIMGDVIPLKSLSPIRPKVQQKILLYHNFFRSRVEPAASNMLRMKWHKGAEKAAQRWADECILLNHDNATGRYIKEYGSCGQNIFISSHRVPWYFAIETWWLEKHFFNFGKENNMTLVGHYTQLVWAATHQVGCGIAKCYHYGNYTTTNAKLFYNYVCNYCPIGNHPSRNPYKLGKPCHHCKKHCKGKLCLNGCKSADHWVNCKELYKAHPLWLCHTKTKEGQARHRNCKATCSCKRKIHEMQES